MNKLIKITHCSVTKKSLYSLSGSSFNKTKLSFASSIYTKKVVLSSSKKPSMCCASAYTSDHVASEFFNQCFDKGRLKKFVLWFSHRHGEHKTVKLVEQLKTIGFEHARKAGISLGIDDLVVPPKKAKLLLEAEIETRKTMQYFRRGDITGVERFQRLIDTWHNTSEHLKKEVVEHYRHQHPMNPVYMMAFSGARGNISQVRQLVGMRGLMADPQGRIIDYPIRSNFREGLTLTEYLISSYGARKGIVDTALRTADAGYLTRRLVDVAQHVIVTNFDCKTRRGIFLTDIKEGKKKIHPLRKRAIGRVLAKSLISNVVVTTKTVVEQGTVFKAQSINPVLWEGKRNQEITSEMASIIAKKYSRVFVRSPLTCDTHMSVCQLCYGWSLARGNLVSIGEAVGVVAAQSIGEPGTQLTMRTFHTGGVFSGDVQDVIRAPFNGTVVFDSPIPGTLIRMPEGVVAFLTKSEGSLHIKRYASNNLTNIDTVFNRDSSARYCLRDSLNKGDLGVSTNFKFKKRSFTLPAYTILYLRHGQHVLKKQMIARITNNRTDAKTLTDAAEFTLHSDLEGLLYIKSADIRYSNSPGSVLNPITCTWGYSWVLSGRFFPARDSDSLFSPKRGDFTVINNCDLPGVNATRFYLHQGETRSSLSVMKTVTEGLSSNKKVIRKGYLVSAKSIHTNKKHNLFNNNSNYNNNNKVKYNYYCPSTSEIVFIKKVDSGLKSGLSSNKQNTGLSSSFYTNTKKTERTDLLLLSKADLFSFYYSSVDDKTKVQKKDYFVSMGVQRQQMTTVSARTRRGLEGPKGISAGSPHNSSSGNRLLGEFVTYGDTVFFIKPLTLKDTHSPGTVRLKEENRDLTEGESTFIYNKETPSQIIHYNRNKVTLRRAQPFYYSPKAILHKNHNDFVEKQAPVVTLQYQRLVTGDIVQGIPKIEQFFEARINNSEQLNVPLRGLSRSRSLPVILKAIFRRFLLDCLHEDNNATLSTKTSTESRRDLQGATARTLDKHQRLQIADRRSISHIQQILVDGVQRVYQSQGVTIADKHLEIIVKQMTSKVRILHSMDEGQIKKDTDEILVRNPNFEGNKKDMDVRRPSGFSFLAGELVDREYIEKINSTLKTVTHKISYEPVVLGISQASLRVNSFLSASSFQHTTTLLAKSAVYNRKDFLRGLKEKVMLGQLIPAGTAALSSLSFFIK